MYLKREKGVYVFILNNRGIVGEWRLFIFGLYGAQNEAYKTIY